MNKDFMKWTTQITEGKISCALHGTMTGIDCKCLQDTPCFGCFIYDAMKDKDSVSTNEEYFKEVN